MKDLTTYLFENLDMIFEAGGFVNLLDKDEISSFFAKSKQDVVKNNADVIQQKFNELFISAGETTPRILYSETESYIKVPYTLASTIMTELTNDNTQDFYYVIDKNNDKKISIMYKKHKISITGKGNYGSKSLDKEIHENLTSYYYNTPEEYWDILDVAITELYSYADMKIWIPSFHEQARAIHTKFGSSLRAVRIDNATNIRKVYNEVNTKLGNVDWAISMTSQDVQVNDMYNIMSNGQKEFIVKSQFETNKLKREAYDKSDIVLYDPSKLGVIKTNSSSINLKDNESLVGIRAKMVEMYANKALVGISLKGLSSAKGKFEMIDFNSDDDPEHGIIKSVKNYTVRPIIRKKGKAYSIQNGFNIDIKTSDGKSMELCLRSFGSNVALEVKFASKPPLGKSPVFLWRKFLEENSKLNPFVGVTSRTVGDVFTGALYNKLADAFGWSVVEEDAKFTFESTNISTIVGLQFLYSLTKLNKQEILDNLSKWSKAAIAEADYAFPFALTEEI